MPVEVDPPVIRAYAVKDESPVPPLGTVSTPVVTWDILTKVVAFPTEVTSPVRLALTVAVPEVLPVPPLPIGNVPVTEVLVDKLRAPNAGSAEAPADRSGCPTVESGPAKPTFEVP